MPHNFRYWAFLSYSHEDSRAAVRLHRALENYVVPRRLVGLDSPFGPIPQRLWPIFRDRDELKPGGRLGSDVEHALELSRSLIVLCSPAAAGSTWVEAEIAAFEAQQPDAPLFCVILGGEPLAKDPAAECLPPILKARYASQPGMAQAAPIAVDLRAHGDGWHRGVQQIVAGLTGLPLDQLVQRDAHQRHVRMAWLSLALAAVVIALGTLTVFAYKARNEAQAQRAQAEGLIEFMLVDLRKKLEPVGGLDAMAAVGSRALRYYDRQPLKSLDPESLGRRARALQLIGEIADRRGDTKDARAAFMRARKSTQELLERDPDDPGRLYNHAQSVYWNGYIDYKYGDMAAAEKAFVEYGRLADQLSAKDPNNPDWLAEVGYSHSNLGTVLMQQGRAAEAISQFRESLRIDRRRATLPGDIAAIQLDIGQDHSWLSSALFADRRLRPAIIERLAELDLYARLDKASPDDVQVKERRMLAHRFLGEMRLAAGELEAARQDIDAATTLAGQLLVVANDNEAWRRTLVTCWLLAAEQARRSGALPRARDYVEKAQNEVAEQLARDPEAVAWRLGMQESTAVERAKQLLQENDLQQAGQVLQAMSARLQTSAPGSQPEQRALQFRIVNAGLLAELARRQGNDDLALANWKSVVGMAGTDADTGTLDGDTASWIARATWELGRRPQALKLARQLQDAGYENALLKFAASSPPRPQGE